MIERAVLVDGTRTPIGNFLGGLSQHSAIDLGAAVIKELAARNKVKPETVIMGNVVSAGLGQNPAREAAIYAGLPKETVAFTVNDVCGSGMLSLMLAAREINANPDAVIIAGGMESMSNAPFLLRDARKLNKYGNFLLKKENVLEEGMSLVDSLVYDGLWDCYNSAHMGTLAEKTAEKYRITREESDAFALESHRRAVASREKLRQETIQMGTVEYDEHPRNDTGMEKLGALKTVFKENGTITAGNASSLSDGAAAFLVMGEKKARKLKKKPLAAIEDFTISYREPEWYTIAPVDAVKNLMRKLKRKISDYDLIEINEAYAVQTLAVMKQLKIRHQRLNVNGGAIALGHPIGASGARIVLTLLSELRRRKLKYGLATLCQGGGGASAISLVI